jgi:superfamily II DNA/RNA helicase
MIGEVEHRFVAVEHEAKLDELVTQLATGERGLALVFVRTKRGAARLARRLEQRGVRAGALHGDMSQAQRQRSLKQFESGRVDVLVATDVAARGLDVDDVTHVINFDPPADAVAYTHRVGRTGRAGRSGIGITFVIEDERADITKLADEAGLGTELDLAGLRLQRQASARKGGRRGGNGNGGGQNRRRRPAAA